MKVSTLLLLLVPGAAAFSLSTSSARPSTKLSSSVTTPTRPDFYKAVQAAASTSRINIDDLDRMASELEDVQGCAYEGGELCEKEIQDRLDVAGVLRLKIELQLR